MATNLLYTYGGKFLGVLSLKKEIYLVIGSRRFFFLTVDAMTIGVNYVLFFFL